MSTSLPSAEHLTIQQNRLIITQLAVTVLNSLLNTANISECLALRVKSTPTDLAATKKRLLSGVIPKVISVSS